MLILWHDWKYDWTQVLFHCLSAATPAYAGDQDRFTQSIKHTLCGFLFYRPDDHYGRAPLRFQKDIQLHLSSLSRQKTCRGFQQDV